MIYANAVQLEVERMCNEFCCGCKVREQDYLMSDEYETWQLYGLEAVEQVTRMIWSRFVELEHWEQLTKDPDSILT